jgi:hypothetical protein
MKIQLTQSGTTVTIEREGDGQNGDQMAQLCRELLLAQGYHPNTVAECLPTEEDVVEQIQEALEFQKNESFLEKEVDTDEELTEYTP